MPNFDGIFNNSSENIKLKFLEEKIRYNLSLQEEFLAYLKAERSPVTPVSSVNFNQLVYRIREKYKNLFEKVDIENPDWDNYVPPHSGYIEEWETYQLASEQEFEQIFEDFGSNVVDKIISHAFDEVLAMLIGLYEAAQNAEIPDDIGSFSDVNEFLLEEHGIVMNTLVDKIKLSAISGKSSRDTIPLFLNYCAFEYPGNPLFPSYFEPLLLAFAEKSDQPVLLLEITRQSEVTLQSLPLLLLLLLKKSGNMPEWLRVARLYYRENIAVAKELLDNYFTANKPAFIETARELFPTNKREWSEFLQRYLTPDFDRNLFVQVFFQLTVFHSSLEYYYKIQRLLSAQEFELLLTMVHGNKPFLARLLAENKRYDEIKLLVENFPGNHEYLDIIKPILTVYPAFCLENIKTRVTQILVNERGRHIYERIASWLKGFKTIPGFDAEKYLFIQQTYNHKPNLPALKDEMRRAGLV